jgi:hypothetical protein
MQLHEASFAVMDWMLHIAATEGRMPNIAVHSIAGCGQGQVSVWLELDTKPFWAMTIQAW